MSGRPAKAKCEKCGRSFKSAKYLNQHKCSVEIPKVEPLEVEPLKVESLEVKSAEPKNADYVICQDCFKDIYKKNYARHRVVCTSHNLIEKFMPVFLFVARLIRAYNNKIKQENYLGNKKDKKKIIYDYYTGKIHDPKERENEINNINLNENRKFLGLRLAEKESEEVRKVEMYARIRKIKHYPLKNIIEVNNGFNPSISARQVIYEYLDSIKIYDEGLNRKIERFIGEGDFYTDVELLSFSPEFYVNISRLRKIYDESYYKTFGEFLFKIKEVLENPERFLCQWCLKYFGNLRQHTNRCREFKKNYKSFPSETIDKFLSTFYNKIEPEQYSEINYYFFQRPCQNFLEGIAPYIKNKISFIKEEMKKEEEKKERRMKLLGKKRYGKKELIEEIHKWVDCPKKVMKLKKIKSVIKHKTEKKKEGILVQASPVKEKKEVIKQATMEDLLKSNKRYIDAINLFNNCKFIININKK